MVTTNKREIWGLGYSSVVQHFSSIYETLGLIPGRRKRVKKKGRREGVQCIVFKTAEAKREIKKIDSLQWEAGYKKRRE